MNKKFVPLITVVGLLFVLILTPAGINANNSELKLTVVNVENDGLGEEVRSQLSKARGIEVRKDFVFEITSQLTDEQKESSDSFAFSAKDLSTKDIEQIRSLIDSQKTVYLYGKITRSQANEIFSERVFHVLDEQELTSELKEKGIKETEIPKLVAEELKKNKRTFDVIGGYKVDDKIVPYTATIQDDTELTLAHYIDAMLDNINDEYLASNTFFGTLVAHATQVDSSPDHNSTAYVGGVKTANINMDYYLEQDLDETDVDYDHFALKDHMEFTTYNGADPWLMRVYHDITYANTCSSGDPCDNLKDWDPDDITNESSFTVALPWSIGWTFSTNDDIDIDVTGNQTKDYVYWDIDEARTWSSYLHNPERVTPGNAWISTGTLAYISIENRAWYDYNGQTRDLQFNFDYKYDY
jgi:hypothetical protein